MSSKKTKKKPHTVELTPQHVAKTIEEVLRPFENCQENEGKTLVLELSSELFKQAGASRFVSTRSLNANPELFRKDVQIELVPELWRKKGTSAPHCLAVCHQILSIEDNSDDGLYVTAEVKIHGLMAFPSYQPEKQVDFFTPVNA